MKPSRMSFIALAVKSRVLSGERVAAKPAIVKSTPIFLAKRRKPTTVSS